MATGDDDDDDDDDDDAYCGEDDGEKDSTRQAAHMSRRVAETTMLEAAAWSVRFA